MGELANWQCHKIVKAGKIKILPMEKDGKPIGPVVVEDVNGVNAAVAVDDNIFARGWPQLGDYLVIYDDGYKSWSPAKAFKEGYTRL